jgi:hypothetical protein
MTREEQEMLRAKVETSVRGAVDAAAEEARSFLLPHESFLVRAVNAGFDALIAALFDAMGDGEKK